MLDTVTSAQEVLWQKRVVTTIVGGLVLGGLSSLGTFAFNRITAEVGTTLVLENGSTEDAPFILIDPRYRCVAETSRFMLVLRLLFMQ